MTDIKLYMASGSILNFTLEAGSTVEGLQKTLDSAKQNNQTVIIADVIVNPENVEAAVPDR